jgi:methylenetetrahydrofolate dehydrogenase (NADP+) / methenyltetrahydrofolate cyclohydrolase
MTEIQNSKPNKKNKIIDGIALAEKIKDKIVKEIILINHGRETAAWERPNLAIILVGDREDSRLYVAMKEREAKKVGIDTHVYRCAADTPEKEILAMIEYLNKDPLIDAILVQLPLPEGFDTDKIIRTLDPEKDADRFHPENRKILLNTCDHGRIMPPVQAVILEILENVKCDPAGKIAVIIANSAIFGSTIAKALECRGATTAIVKADDNDLQNKTLQADILISAAGRAKLITAAMVKPGAVVIDVGISREVKGVRGDVDFENVKKVAGHITPVPGGVGPMTIAMLFRNTLELYKRKRGK